eukprot:725421-Prymnesium_polylepis.1
MHVDTRIALRARRLRAAFYLLYYFLGFEVTRGHGGSHLHTSMMHTVCTRPAARGYAPACSDGAPWLRIVASRRLCMNGSF